MITDAEIAEFEALSVRIRQEARTMLDSAYRNLGSQKKVGEYYGFSAGSMGQILHGTLSIGNALQIIRRENAKEVRSRPTEVPEKCIGWGW